jgi:mannosyltransferase OCH1-like enzyme
VVIDYFSPSEYYTKKNIEDRGFVMFWERVCERKNHKKITAIIDITYKDAEGKDVKFNSAKEFYIDYTEEYI